MAFWNKYRAILLILTSVILYFFIAYFLEREQFNWLLFSYFSLFICFYFLVKFEHKNSSILIGASLLFRLVFLCSIPNLSQDFYRFIWDGRMILEGFNPYLWLPQTFIFEHNFPIADAPFLYQGMGELNGSHYTNYPPIHQFCFLISAFFGNKIFTSVIVLRIIIILADVGILYFGKKLLEKFNIPVYTIFWFILNPFVIIELTGNLHFESVMLFFLVWSLYKLQQKKWVFAAVLFACSISVKLIPLLFLPLFYQWFTKAENKNGFKKLIAFYVIVLATTIVFFLPFYSSTLIENYLNSVGLWFQKFEFNASIYYLLREIGFWIYGYNQIALIGKITPILTVLFLLYFAFFKKNASLKKVIISMLFVLSFYYFTTTTMHPWYLSTLILLAVFTKYRFPIVWSLVIILSYAAYSNNNYQENFWFISLEYIIVYGFLIWELYAKKNANNIFAFNTSN